jgi:hypothetical protein
MSLIRAALRGGGDGGEDHAAVLGAMAPGRGVSERRKMILRVGWRGTGEARIEFLKHSPI